MNKNILYPAVVIVFLVVGFSCKGPQTEQITALLPITDSLIQSLETVTARMTDNDTEIKLNGKVVASEARMAKVFAMVSGKVQGVYAELGDYVKKGQKLGTLRSAEIAEASNELTISEANVKLAEKNLQTVKDLYEGKLATEQEYINAKIEYNKALAALNRARQVSAITGGNNEIMHLTAPINGYVVEKNVSDNTEIRQDNDASLFTIADLSEVSVLANVYETDIRGIREGDDVIVNTLAFPDRNYKGRIDKLFRVLDPSTRTMQVRINLSNQDLSLRPEMYAAVKVKLRAEGRVLTIPARALVMESSKYYVILKKDSTISVKEVDLLKRNEHTAFIRGLNDGDEVVISSQIFLYQALTEN